MLDTMLMLRPTNRMNEVGIYVNRVHYEGHLYVLALRVVEPVARTVI
jgi:hypothetical protein